MFAPERLKAAMAGRFWRTGTPSAPPPSPAAARRGFSVGIYPLLLWLPLLMLLPVLAFGTVLLYVMAGHATETARKDLVAANAALMATVHREISQSEQLLALMARSPVFSAAPPDPERLEHLMKTLLMQGFQEIRVHARGGDLLAQEPRTPGESAGGALSEHDLRGLESARATLSDLHPVRSGGPWAMSIHVPVVRDGQARFILSGRMDPSRLTRLMQEQLGTRQAIGSVLDTQMRIVARTDEGDRFRGQLPSVETQERFRLGSTGLDRFRTLDGNELLWAWSSTPAGWRVALGIPALAVDQALARSVLSLGAAGAGVLLLGVVLTAFLAWRIARSVDRMATTAHHLASGEAVSAPRSGIRQLDTLYDALAVARANIAKALSDRDRALAAERVARSAADEDNRLKDVFLATLSHELRNPLAPIRSAAFVLNAEGSDERKRAWATRVIERQAATMARLLDDLLDLSRITSGRIDLERRPVALADILDEAVETVRPLVDGKGQDLQVRGEFEGLELMADPLRLSQVMTNLLTNASRYTQVGGRIEVIVEAREAQVTVRVRDNGIGIASADLPGIFDMFAQVRGPLNRSDGGLGIGLSLVRGLVELHGGTVEATSPGLGQGSEFVVRLPRGVAAIH
jgi:signal transduction histidine kinase